jgi:CRISPR/Cas system-associated exonuclease Cas4 (RecB family)
LNLAEKLKKLMLKAQEEKRKELKNGVYYPSLLFSCMRRTYYQYRKQKMFPEDVESILYAGTKIHEVFAQLLEQVAQEIKAEFSTEVPIRLVKPREEGNPVVISGRADDVFVLEGEETIVVELKTTASLDRLLEKGLLPKTAHVKQLNVYLAGYPGALGILIYIDRNTFRCVQFEVKFDSKMLIETFERAERLHEALTSERLPPPEAKNDPEERWQCRNCPYLEECALDLDVVPENLSKSSNG